MSELSDHLQGVLNRVNTEIARNKSVLLVGHAGGGKTMVARRAQARIAEARQRDISAIHRMACLSNTPEWVPNPFRAPHHTVSVTGLVGDGRNFRPGELSLAHGGVLFLDEVDEFQTRCLEAVARAWENKCVEYGLCSQWLRGLPADFALIGAVNEPEYEELTRNWATYQDRRKRLLSILPFDVEIEV